MTDTVRAWIEERRAIIREACESIRPADAVELGLIDLPRALDAIERVLELHKPMPDGNCVSCTWFSDGNIVPHPCPTVQTIEGVIDGD